MAITGRKPKPVEVQVREGNPGKQALPEPLLVSGRPTDDDPMLECPPDMPAAGKEAWDAVVPSLAEVGLLDRVDRLAIEAMCISWARAKQAGKVIARQGHLVKGSNGQLREHPSLRTERESFRLFQSFGEQFALTPVRRTLAAEMTGALGDVELTEVPDAEVVDDVDADFET
jgi:P27 family predicted phage terminase small subunit